MSSHALPVLCPVVGAGVEEKALAGLAPTEVQGFTAGSEALFL